MPLLFYFSSSRAFTLVKNCPSKASASFKIDTWSLGIVAYTVISGYQPFRSEDQERLKRDIVRGVFDFDEKVWSSISSQAKSFIASLLKAKPEERLSSEEALEHEWLSTQIEDNVDQHEVFFMIGSQ